MSIAYSQGGTEVTDPTDAGTYDVTATIDETDYTGSASGQLVIDVAPGVSLDSGAAAVTNSSPIHVTATFTKDVTGFTAADITVGNGAVSNFAGSGSAFTFDVTPSGQGAVTVDVAVDAAQDASGIGNTAALTLTRTYDSVAPTVTATPAGTSFDSSIDVTLESSDATASVHYTVDGSTPDGSSTAYVGAISLAATTTLKFVAIDAAGNSSDVGSETYTLNPVVTGPTVVSIVPVATPTNAATADFTVTFSEPVTGVDTHHFSMATTGFTKAPSISSVATESGTSGDTWTVTVDTGTGDGTIDLHLDKQLSGITSAADGTALQSAYTTGDLLTVDKTAPVLSITSLSDGERVTQPDPELDYTVSDTAPAASSGLGALGQPAGVPVILVWEDGKASPTRNGQKLGPYAEGVHTVTVEAIDVAGNSTTVSVTFTVDLHDPAVTIDQASSQSDPATSGPIMFTVVFSEPVTGFATGDVVLGGTAGATTATVSEASPNDGTTYHVAVSGMTASGTVTASVPAGVAVDSIANANPASTSTDDTVTYNKPVPYTPPVITVPADMTVEATGATGARVSFTSLVSAVEPVDGGVTWTSSPASGSVFALDKATTVTVTATDAAGHTATKTFKVTVVDTSAPVIAAKTSYTFYASGPAGATVTASMLGVTASDRVSGAVSITYGTSLPSVFRLGGPTKLDLVATDAHGNKAVFTTSIYVVYGWAKWTDPTKPALRVGDALKVAFKLRSKLTNAVALLTITGPGGVKKVDAQPFTYWAPTGEYRYVAGQAFGISTMGWAKGAYVISADLGDGVQHLLTITLK